MKRFIDLLFLISISAAACFAQTTSSTPTPKKKGFQKPVVQIPQALDRSAPPAQSDPQTLANLKWFEVFKDQSLQDLVKDALVYNYDLREAVARVDAARAQLGITRADQFPTIGASASYAITGTSRDGQFPIAANQDRTRSFGSFLLNLLSFEVDIWGRARKATEAARADLFASEESRLAVITTLVSDVATSYYNLLELDYELRIANNTLQSRQDSLKIVKSRYDRGVSNQLELRQSEELVYNATELIPKIQQDIEIQENYLSVLTGKNPQAISRGLTLTDQEMPLSVPPGLPSDLLERRPDIRSAEQELIAANARIDVAKKAYFPRITLTGFFGFQSGELSNLFNISRTAWSFVPEVTQPIFTGGRIKSNIRYTQAQRDFLIANYEKTIQNSFREVADALVAYRKVREVREQRELLVKTLQDRSRLAYLRYNYGVANLLEALDADRELFSAELNLAQARRDELLTVVQIYKALGGGWQ